MGKNIDLKGQKFGRLSCLDPVEVRNGHRVWRCQCECGNFVEVTTGNLRSLHTQSCGCLQRERTSKAKTVHGLYHDETGKRSKLYRVWGGMRERCENPNHSAYKDYGGRGIVVCEEWMEYKSFHSWALANGYKPGLSIERMNNNGNYEPGNCVWIRQELQAKNRRNNHYLTFRKETKTITEWAKHLGINQKNLQNRIRRGWAVERALTTPDRRKNENT